MEDNGDFVQQLEEGLKAKRMELESSTLPALKEDLRNFGNTYHMMYTYLVQKGFLKEDHYNYEQTSSLEPPSSEPIADGEMVSELSYRLSNYDSVMDYLNNVYDVDIDKLSLGGIKKILSVIDYIKWSNLGSNTTHSITRGLSLIMDKIVTSNNDPVSSEIRFNSVTAQTNNCNNIKKKLKEISLYQREAYKFRIRSVIMPSVNPTSEMVSKDMKGLLMAVKLEIGSQLPGSPFYRELIEEIFDEDFGFDGEQKRASLLKRMNISTRKEQKKAKKKEPERKVDKHTLLKIIPDLSKSGDQMGTALAKLEHNKEVTSSKKKSLGEILRRFFQRKENDVYYEVKTTDPVSGHTRRIKLNFTTLTGQIRQKAQLLRTIGNTNSQQYEKLSQYSEDMLKEFIENNLMEIRSFHRKMAGLDEMFKKEDDPAVKAKIKGIRVETDTMKRLYMECNKSLKEYLAIKEEMAQLKALGIED